MSFETWLNYLRSAEKLSLSGQVRKIFYKFPDGQQMEEEYSLDTDIVLRRAWRKSRQLMGEPEWETELGETVRQNNSIAKGESIDFTLRESTTTPILTKRITKKNIEWRICNMPYPLEVYTVTVESEKRTIIVRTTNKKYYKEIQVPELMRCGLTAEQKRLSVHHQHNTLIITYAKPDKVSELESQVLRLLKDVQTEFGS